MLIRPIPWGYDELVLRIAQGYIKIPAFQRSFVWPMPNTLKLLDSICRRYPIGTFLVWQTREYLGSLRNIGSLTLAELPAGFPVQYILDGQQRITSLYAAVNATEINGREYRIFADLDSTNESEEILSLVNSDDARFVSLADMLGDNASHVSHSLTEARRRRFVEIRDAFKLYQFSTVIVEGGELGVICDIFERINNTGKKLSTYDLLVARTLGEGFNLRESYLRLLEELPAEFKIPETVIASLAGAIIKKSCARKAILGITSEEMQKSWEQISDSIKAAINFVRSMSIPALRLLPYPALLVPIAYFPYLRGRNPNGPQSEWLSRYLYLAGFSGHLSGSSDTQLTEDLKKIQNLIDGEFPELDMQAKIASEEILRIELKVGPADCLSALCLLAKQTPLNLETGNVIWLRDDSLRRADSQHYHHIFPKAYMRGKNGEEFVNSIANIMFIPADINWSIGKKKPSEYLPPYENGNPKWQDTLKSHLLDGEVYEALIADDFPRFIETRAKRLSELAQKMTTQS